MNREAVVVVLALSMMLGTAPQPPRLKARFIGQMAVAISDGSTTVMSDCVVIYHHRTGQPVPRCTGTCTAPGQGDAIELP